MKQRKVSKNTTLISNGNFEDTSFRPLNQHLVNVNKGYHNNLFLHSLDVGLMVEKKNLQNFHSK